MRIVFCTDKDGIILRSNQALTKAIGNKANCLDGTNLIDLFHKSDQRRVLLGLEQVGQARTSKGFTASLAFSEKNYIWHVSPGRGNYFSVWTGTAIAGPSAAAVSRQQTIPKQPTTLLQADSLYGYLEKMSDALLVLDNNWHYIYLNTKAGELLGYDPQDLIGQHIWTIFPEAVNSQFYQAAHKAMETQEHTEITSLIDRHQKWFERRIYPSPDGLLIFFSDVTDKKMTEEKIYEAQHELQNIKIALNTSSIVYFTDTEGYVTWANENFCKISQYTPEELIGKKHGILTNPFQQDTQADQILATTRKGEIWKGEVQKTAKDGSIIWVASTIVPIRDAGGEVSHNIVFCQDITERKLAEKALAKSEGLYRSLIENYSDAVLLTDLQGNITKANQQSEALSGISQADLQGKNFLQFLSEDDRRKVSAGLPVLLQGKKLELKTAISCFDKPFSCIIIIVPIWEEGAIRHFFIKLRDVSQQVNYEKDLKLINDTSLALSNSQLLQDGISAVIKQLCLYADYHYGEFWMPLFGQSLVKMKSSWWSSNDYRLMKASSEFRSFDIRTDKPLIFGSGKWYFSGCIQKDPSFRRKAEAAACGLQSMLTLPVTYRNQLLGVFVLYARDQRPHPGLDPARLQELLSKLGGELERRNSAEELDRFFNLSPELLGILCFDGHAKKFNAAFKLLLGYTEEEINALVMRDLVHPEDKEKLLQAKEQMVLGHSYKNLELRYRSKEGIYHWLSCSTQSVVEENLIYLTARDITAQKQQLEEIERIKIAIDNTSDAIGITSDLKNCLYTNKSFERLLGWNVENLSTMGWTRIFVDEALPGQVVAYLSEHGNWEGDIELYDTSGNIRDFNLRANTFLQDNGSIKYLIGIFTDIAEQKLAQQEVVRLSKAVEESENEIYIISPANACFTYINRRALENLGYAAADIRTLNPVHINPDYARFSFKKALHTLISGKKKSISYQSHHTRKNGSRYPVEIQLSLFEHGQEKSVLANVADITERRKAQEALMISNERYRLVTRATNDAIWDNDLEKQVVYYGEGYKTLFGHSFGNTTAGIEHWVENVHPEDTQRVVDNFYDAVVRKRKEWVIEYRFRCTDGSYKFVKDQGYVMFDEAGKAIRATGALADITDQKRTEALLREFNAELEKKVEEKTSKLGHALRLMRQEVIARIRTEETLQQSLLEKEVLLKEIHHRVKNNMAIISGLLSLQARHTKQEELKAILKDSQSRIKSMALIHELLYQHENLAKINFNEYIHQLAAGISSSFHFMDKQISIVIEAEDAEMDIVHAVPCALILNELITNSFKYAFAGKQSGEIWIGFGKHTDTFELKVLDNGIGLPQDFDPQRTKSLGMQLICNLIRQIGGSMQLSTKPGAGFTFVWKE